MFDLKNNNNISTFLLLVVLGLLIWHMTKPNKGKETFTNNLFSDQPIQQIKENMENQIETPVIQLVAPIQPTVVQSTEPIQQVIVKPVEQVQSTVNNFVGYDNGENTNGAEIETAFQPPVTNTNTTINAVDINKQNIQNYNAKDFLPKEINDQWFDTDFSQAKTNISDDKLINTERYVIGINTVGQSLKNASYDIRGTIANPKFSVSPWNNSTYEPDYNIKPLC